MYICMGTAGVFPSAWYNNVRQIASKSPLLLSRGAEQYLDRELELHHPLKIENIAQVSASKSAACRDFLISRLISGGVAGGKAEPH